jgi:hypothetical protein
MAVDTFIAYVGIYPSVEDAEADYQLVKDLHVQAGLIDAYDAAVVERRSDGKLKITKKHETPTRAGGVLGGGGLATGPRRTVPVRGDRWWAGRNHGGRCGARVPLPATPPG